MPSAAKSTAKLDCIKSSNSSLTVFNFSLTLATPSCPTICRDGGFSWPPMAVIAYIVSAVRTSKCAALSGGYVEITSGTEKGPCSPGFAPDCPRFGCPRECSSVALYGVLGKRGMRRLRRTRNNGAWFTDGEYAGTIGGTLVTRLVRMPISMLHSRMVSLTLNGAIS